jgi:hypothetical protein
MTLTNRKADLTQHAPQGLSITNIPSTPVQRRLAIGISLFLILLTVVTLPFAQTQWMTVTPLLPSFLTAVLLLDVITAFPMFSMEGISRICSSVRTPPCMKPNHSGKRTVTMATI